MAFWMVLGIATLFALLLGIALVVSMLQVASLNASNVGLVKQTERLFQLYKALTKEHRALRSALRAEYAHVEQLKRKTELLGLLLDELQAQLKSDRFPRA